MYSICECLIMFSENNLSDKLKEFSGITFQQGESPFADRHPMDLRSPILNESDKEKIDALHLILLKLKELGAINFEIKMINDQQGAETQFIVYEADPAKLMNITSSELDKITIQIGNVSELPSGRTNIYQIQLHRNVEYLRSLAINVKGQEAKIISTQQIPDEEKEIFNSKLDSFCELFNIAKEEVETVEAFRNCFALYAAGAMKVKHSYITGEENGRSAEQVDIVTKKSEIVNSLPRSKSSFFWGAYHDETRLTIYGVALCTVEEKGIFLDLTLAKKFFEEAKQRFLLFASSKYYMESTTVVQNKRMIQRQADYSESTNPIISIRGSNSRQNCIVVTAGQKGKVPEACLVGVEVTSDRKVKVSLGKFEHLNGVYDNVDEFLNVFLKDLFVRQTLGFSDDQTTVQNLVPPASLETANSYLRTLTLFEKPEKEKVANVEKNSFQLN